MSGWSATKARRLLAALRRNGWEVTRSSGSHKTLAKAGYPDYVFSFLRVQTTALNAEALLLVKEEWVLG